MHSTPAAPPPHSPARRRGLALAGLCALVTVGGVGAARATSPDGAAAYVPTNPCRLVDTRPGADNVGSRSTPLGPDDTMTLDGRGEQGNCTGTASLPADATGLQLNVTALSATQVTFLTLYPSGEERPKASHLNPTPGGAAVPNAVTVKLADDGHFDVFNRFGAVDVIIDVVGFYTDHHHDDRYYTRIDSDARYYSRSDSDARYYTRSEVDALTDEPWRVDVPMGSVILQSETPTVLHNNFLSGTVRTEYTYSLRLPDRYEPGTDVLVETMHEMNTSSLGCGVALEVWSVDRYRNGVPVVSPPRSYVSPQPSGQPHQTVLTSVDEARHAGAATFRLDGADLAPGDWIKVRAARLGTHVDDTCPTITLIGITAAAA